MTKVRYRLLAASTCAAMLAASCICPAATIVLTSDADATTRPGVNSGVAPVLDVRGFAGGDFIGYFRFDLSSISGTITDATLTLSKLASARNDTITTGRFLNYGLTNAAGNTPQNWDDSVDLDAGAEYDNTGGNLLDPAQLFNLDADTGANVVETVNNAVVPQQLSGPDFVTFLNQRRTDGGLATIISAVNQSGRGWGWGARENEDPALRPTLELTVVPEPASWLLACAIMLVPVASRRRVR